MSKINSDFVYKIIVFLVVGLFLLGRMMKSTCACLEEDAQVANTVQKIKSIEAALIVFQDTYGVMPGDMVAVDQILKCKNQKCLPGNGDGRLGPLSEGPIIKMQDERKLFWSHLHHADLLDGINPNSTEVAWGKSFPSTILGGGMHIRQATDPHTYPFKNLNGPLNKGLYLVLSDDLNGDFSKHNKATFPTSKVAAIDKKLDDGQPFTGTVQASAPQKCFMEYETGRWIYKEEMDRNCISHIFVQLWQ